MLLEVPDYPVPAPLWFAPFDGSIPRRLADRVTQFCRLAEGRVLTALNVGEDGLGDLIVADFNTREETGRWSQRSCRPGGTWATISSAMRLSMVNARACGWCVFCHRERRHSRDRRRRTRIARTGTTGRRTADAEGAVRDRPTDPPHRGSRPPLLDFGCHRLADSASGTLISVLRIGVKRGRYPL